MGRAKRQAWVSSRTLQSVKDAVRSDAIGQHRSDSEVLHLLLCHHYGIDPATRERRAEDMDHGATGQQ